VTDTIARINRIIVEQLGVEPWRVLPATLLVPAHDRKGRLTGSDTPDLGCDSLDVVELVMALEEEFRIEIPDGEAEPLNRDTVQGLYDLVERKRGE
jgi:acyl carrier protein